jgi:hypothetical protein
MSAESVSKHQYRHYRRRLFVDPKVQGALLVRTVLYYIYSLLTVSLMVLCWRVLTNPVQPFATHLQEMWQQFGPAVIASLLVVPLMVFDTLRLSNRFAGPLVRLRRSIQELAKGQEVPPIYFRGHDFWQQFADDFNALSTCVRDERRQLQRQNDTAPIPLETAPTQHA